MTGSRSKYSGRIQNNRVAFQTMGCIQNDRVAFRVTGSGSKKWAAFGMTGGVWSGRVAFETVGCVQNDGAVFGVTGLGWKQWACVQNDGVAFRVMGLLQNNGLCSELRDCIQNDGHALNNGLAFEPTDLPLNIQLLFQGMRQRLLLRPHLCWLSTSMVVARVIVSHLKSEVAGQAGIRYIVCVVKRAVGSGFDIKGRGGMGMGLPESKLKVGGGGSKISSRRLDWFPIKHTKI